MEIDNGLKVLSEYFALSNHQQKLFGQLANNLEILNAQVNVISRKDFPFLFERHILHSLALAKHDVFTPGNVILDLGTGGGFPGLPLAILYPSCSFILIDSIIKKIRVVDTLVKNLKLENVQSHAIRAEDYRIDRLDWIISRAVAPAADIRKWGINMCPSLKRVSKPGFLLLKGGNLHIELAELPVSFQLIPILPLIDRAFFAEKFIVQF